MTVRLLAVALVLLVGCTHQIEFRPENSEQAKIEKAILRVEGVATDLEAQQATELKRVEIKPGGCGFIHITRDELPAPHPIDLPETHPKDLPDAEPCPSHPKDLPIGESRFITFKSIGIGVHQVQYAYPVYITGTAYQYLPTPAYVEYGKPPERLTGRTDPELELKLNTVYERLYKHINDSVGDKLMLLHQRDQIRDLEFEVLKLKLLVGELLKRKQVP